jgi:hypothetical protein
MSPVDGDSAFTSQLGCISNSHFHMLSHNTVLPPSSLNLRDTVSPQKAVTRVPLLGVGQTLLLPPEADLNSNLGSYQSDERGSQHGSQAFQGSFL